MKNLMMSAMLVAVVLTACNNSENNKNDKLMTTLELTQQWDKTFPKSDKVDHKKVTFHNRFGIE